MWLAAENGMFLRLTKGKWMTTMPENLHMDWVDSVKVCILITWFFNRKLLVVLFTWRFIDFYDYRYFVYDFSMFLSILLKENLDPILRFVKLLLYGTTSTQVPEIYIYIYICPYFLLVKIFWLCCVCYFVHLLINLGKNVTTTLDIEWKASSKGYVAASVDRSNFQCICWCHPRWPICWGPSSRCYEGKLGVFSYLFCAFSYHMLFYLQPGKKSHVNISFSMILCVYRVQLLIVSWER